MSGTVPQSSLCRKSAITRKQAASPHWKCIRFLRLQLPIFTRRITPNSATQTVDHAQTSDLVVGIDLGTTNSAVAVSFARTEAFLSLALSKPTTCKTFLVLQRFVGRRPVIIKQEGNANTIPSVVSYLPDGKVIVGKAAQRWMPASTARWI